jgi:hypothetical protein
MPRISPESFAFDNFATIQQGVKSAIEHGWSVWINMHKPVDSNDIITNSSPPTNYSSSGTLGDNPSRDAEASGVAPFPNTDYYVDDLACLINWLQFLKDDGQIELETPSTFYDRCMVTGMSPGLDSSTGALGVLSANTTIVAGDNFTATRVGYREGSFGAFTARPQPLLRHVNQLTSTGRVRLAIYGIYRKDRWSRLNISGAITDQVIADVALPDAVDFGYDQDERGYYTFWEWAPEPSQPTMQVGEEYIVQLV